MVRWAALAAAFGATAAVAAEPSINVDLMTVSGRHALAQAGPTSPKLKLAEVSVAPAAQQASGFEPELFRAALEQAATRSLSNFGYQVAQSEGQASTASLELTKVEVAEIAEGARVSVSIRLSAPQAPASCLPRESAATFRSLSRLKSGNSRRVVGVLGTVAALGTDGGAIMAHHFDAASHENRAVNSKRVTAPGEGVAPRHGEKSVLQFGVANAVQLALADVIAHLGSPACASGADQLALSSSGTP